MSVISGMENRISGAQKWRDGGREKPTSDGYFCIYSLKIKILRLREMYEILERPPETVLTIAFFAFVVAI